MIYIIAGNHAQAKNWMKANHLIENKEAKYIYSEEQLAGLPDKIIAVYIGTFYQLENLDMIQLMLEGMQAIELREFG